MPTTSNARQHLSAVQQKLLSTKSAVRKKVKRSNTMGSPSSTSAPTSPGTIRRKPAAPPPEPRYTKSVYLLMEAKKVAREVEEKKAAGQLRPLSARNTYRVRSGSGNSAGALTKQPGSADGLNEKPEVQGRLTPSSSRPKGFVEPPSSKRCYECDRSLMPGSFSQHRGLSYCNVPCYPSLFSTLVERDEAATEPSTLIEEHRKLQRSLLPKLRTYNTYYAGKPCQISCREENGRLILEGLLKVYWGVKTSVTLTDSDMSYWKHFHPRSGGQGDSGDGRVGDQENIPPVDPPGKRTRKRTKSKLQLGRAKSNDLARSAVKLKATNDAEEKSATEHSAHAGHAKHRIGCSVCNAAANGDQSDAVDMFTPPYGTPTSLRLHNEITTPGVVRMLLRKFMIKDPAEKFTLFTVYENGGVRRLPPDSHPLLTRLSLGPCEDVAKIFIMEAADQSDISLEVAQYINFAQPVLETFVQKFREEEEREVERIKEKYADYKKLLVERMRELERSSSRRF